MTQPGINTTATNGTAGGTISDTAQITGLFQPITGAGAGTVTFFLYSGPGGANAVCARATCSSNRRRRRSTWDESAVGDGHEPPINTAGNYHWVASFSGDANNLPVAGVCGAAGESSVVARNQPGINTTATNGTAGGTISDTAQITGLVNPITGANAGTVTFSLYSGPGGANAVCTAANLVFQSAPQPINFGTTPPSATITSPPINTAGTYHWVARFSGDANNLPVAGVCGAAGETSVVAPVSRASTRRRPTARPAGRSLTRRRSRVLSNPITGANAGTVTFFLYSGPGGVNAVCDQGNLVFQSTPQAINFGTTPPSATVTSPPSIRRGRITRSPRSPATPTKPACGGCVSDGGRDERRSSESAGHRHDGDQRHRWRDDLRYGADHRSCQSGHGCWCWDGDVLALQRSGWRERRLWPGQPGLPVDAAGDQLRDDAAVGDDHARREYRGDLSLGRLVLRRCQQPAL